MPTSLLIYRIWDKTMISLNSFPCANRKNEARSHDNLSQQELEVYIFIGGIFLTPPLTYQLITWLAIALMRWKAR